MSSIRINKAIGINTYYICWCFSLLYGCLLFWIKYDTNDHYLKYGDSLRIVCSSTNHEILKVTGYKPGLSIEY